MLYKSPNKKNRINYKDKPIYKSDVEGEELWSFDKEKKEVTVYYHQEPHIPIAVYKALVKSAISTIESKEEIEPFRLTIQWLLNPDHSQSVINPVPLWWTFVPGPRPINGVSTFIFRRRASVMVVPYAIAIFGFGNSFFQFIVPSHFDANKKMNLEIPFFPFPFECPDLWPFGEPQFSLMDLSGTEKIKREFPLKYTYSEIF